MPSRKSVPDRLAQLRKNAGVRRTDLSRVLGPPVLKLWAIEGAGLETVRAVTILHVESVIKTFKDEKTRLIARVAYNISHEVSAQTLGDRLTRLSDLKGKGYSLRALSQHINDVIGPEVEAMLARPLNRPSQEVIDRVAAREADYSPDAEAPSSTWAVMTDGQAVLDAAALPDAINGLFEPPEAAADRAVQAFLRSTVYAPRPREVGYVVRVTADTGQVVCVFHDLESLRRFQQTHNPTWSGDYLAMAGIDLVREVARRLPSDVGIILDPDVAGETQRSSLFLPPSLVDRLYHEHPISV